MKEINMATGEIILVDDDDFDKLNKIKWHNHHNYARHSYRVKDKVHTIFMHVLIMMPSKGMRVDHIDGNRLNNTRSNLRIITGKENTSFSFIKKGYTKAKCSVCCDHLHYEEISYLYASHKTAKHNNQTLRLCTQCADKIIKIIDLIS